MNIKVDLDSLHVARTDYPDLTRDQQDHIKRSFENERRQVERREPKAGVNIRHDDGTYVPQRIRRNK